VNYFANLDYYSEVLCENKDVEDSCCHGKCAMEKELVSLDETDESQPAKSDNPILKFSKVEEALCYSMILFTGTQKPVLILTPFLGKPAKGEHTRIFKPPGQLA
jgi:hypothetical protein